MMQYHILNGDALKAQIPVDKIIGEFIICRECLIDGTIQGDSLMEFWDNRAVFIEKTYGTEPGKYKDYVLPQFQKILDINKEDSIHLWFGDDLFCQMNLCFIIYLLDSIGHRDNIFLVKAQKDNWHEFGGMSKEELVIAFEHRQAMTVVEFQLMLNCWTAFQQNDFGQLKTLAQTPTSNFPLLKEVIQAHIDRFPTDGKLGRPQRQLIKLKERLKTTDFRKIFPQFIKEEGIYGFGDSQVKLMFKSL